MIENRYKSDLSDGFKAMNPDGMSQEVRDIIDCLNDPGLLAARPELARKIKKLQKTDPNRNHSRALWFVLGAITAGLLI